jgi:hypothetical protein
MFQNRMTGFVPSMSAPTFTPGMFPAAQDNRTAQPSPIAVQIADIYQAAAQRAIEEHEIDKLFNPQFYDYQI